MKGLHRVLPFLLILTLGGTLGADALNMAPGSQYLFLGSGVREYSLGFTGYSTMDSLEGGSFNPAALGNLRRLANTLTVGGLGSDNILLSLGFAIPTDSGVFSVAAGFLSGSDAFATGFDHVLSLSVGIAKPITENLFWGFNIKGQRVDFPSAAWGVGFDMGIIYRDDEAKDTGFGFRDFSWGLTLKNIGYPLTTKEYDEFPGMGLGSGIGFNFIKAKGYTMRVLLDGTLTFLPLDFSINAGIEQTLFDMFKLRVGYLLRNKSFGLPQTGAFTFGLGVSGKLTFKEPTDIDISYALVPQKFNGKSETAHFLNLSVAWGYYDSKKPEVKVRPDVTHFSPNYDGSQDRVKLLLNIKDNTMVDGWLVEVKDGTGKTVREFKSLERLKIRSLNVSKFVSQIFSKRRQVEIPDHVQWNGQDEKGNRVTDGTYHVLLTAWDNNKNRSTYQGSVVVDTVMPAVVASAADKVFSPNDDGAKEAISFALAPQSVAEGDNVVARVLNREGAVMRTWALGDKVPATISWDGKTDTGAASPEGLYRLVVQASDVAGNKTENVLFGIRLVRSYETAGISVSAQAFSPGNKGGNASVVLRPVASSADGLEKWTIRILDSTQREARVFTGTGTLPQDILWDGKDDNGDFLADGFYKFRLQLVYDSGNHPQSVEQFVEIDRTPAVVTVKAEYEEFSPNNDNRRDTIAFDHTVSGHAADGITLRIVDASGTEYLRKSFTKDSFPARFVWDGLDEQKKPLPEGLYSYIIETVDKVGNQSRAEVANVRLKTGLEQVAVKSGVSAFSPGKNSAVFTPQISEKTVKDVTGFELVIRDAAGTPVRTFKSDKPLPRIEWDGKDDAGRQVKDGRYSYNLKVSYSFGDQPVSVNRALVVDTKAPEIGLKAPDTIFSPNGDGRKETFSFTQKVQGDREDRYTSAFHDAQDRPVRKFSWKGTVPDSLVWDGVDDSGKPVPPGTYTYRISGVDNAGNRTVSEIKGIKLVRAIPELTFSSDGKYFSPNGDGKQDALTFSARVSSSDDLETSELKIYDIARRLVRTFTFKGSLPDSVVWDGKNDAGTVEGDGLYEAQLVVNYRNGNLLQKDIAGIRLDGQPPAGSLTVAPAVFTPDGDGENDVLFLNVNLRDFTGIKDWRLAVFKKGDSQPFRTFTGEGGRTVAQLINWDGKSADGQDTVDAVEDYIVRLDAVDNLGNRMPTIEKEFTVGVLVEKTPRGLRIRVSSIVFATDSANLVQGSNDKLNKVIYILRRILSDPGKYGLSSNARIMISGHTDDVGPADYNKTLSLQRAKSVRDYMVKNDIDPAILGHEGQGKDDPYLVIRPGMSAARINYIRARNRRVEFFIQK